MQNTRTTRRTETRAELPTQPPRVAEVVRPKSVWGYVWRKLVLLDGAVEERIKRWAVGR